MPGANVNRVSTAEKMLPLRRRLRRLLSTIDACTEAHGFMLNCGHRVLRVVKNVSLALCGNWASPLSAPNIARSRRTVRKEYQWLPTCREQDFHADRPNQKWTTDTTYIWTREGWLYLAVVLDLYSRMVVGWSMAATQDATLVLQALQMAIARRWTASGVTPSLGSW